jgi:hypothetical protein
MMGGSHSANSSSSTNNERSQPVCY